MHCNGQNEIFSPKNIIVLLRKKENSSHSLSLSITNITKTCPCNIKAFFQEAKIENFNGKCFDVFIIFALNIHCGYTLEPPRRNEYLQCMIWSINKNIRYTPANSSFSIQKWGLKVYTFPIHVLLMQTPFKSNWEMSRAIKIYEKQRTGCFPKVDIQLPYQI